MSRLRPAEAARLLGLTPGTLRTLVKAGRLTPEYTEGGHARYHRNDIDRLLLERTAEHSKNQPPALSYAAQTHEREFWRGVRTLTKKLDHDPEARGRFLKYQNARTKRRKSPHG